MKSVGEVMAIGRTFKEALGKGIRSLETGRQFGSETFDVNLIPQKLITPTPDRLELSALRFRARLHGGADSRDDVDRSVVSRTAAADGRIRNELDGGSLNGRAHGATLLEAKRLGISDAQIGAMRGIRPSSTCATRRKELGIQRRVQSRRYLRGGV